MTNKNYTLECTLCNTRKEFKNFKAFERAFRKEMAKHPSPTAKALSFSYDLTVTSIAIL
jgi:hypothetical protein